MANKLIDTKKNQGRKVEIEQPVGTLKSPLTNTSQNTQYDHTTRAEEHCSLGFLYRTQQMSFYLFLNS